MMTNNQEEDTKPTILGVRITQQMRERLRKFAEKNGVSLGQTIKMAVDDFLRNRGL